MYEDGFIGGRDGFVQAVLLQGAGVALWSKHESQDFFL
jgi:hypothetical protein